LELDQLTLIVRQDAAGHEARNSKLFNYFKQINLGVQLGQTFSVQSVVFVRAEYSHFFRSTTTYVEIAAHDTSCSSLDICEEPLRPVVSEHIS